MAITTLGSRKNSEWHARRSVHPNAGFSVREYAMRADARCSIVAKDFLRNQRNRAVRLRAQERMGFTPRTNRFNTNFSPASGGRAPLSLELIHGVAHPHED